MRCPFLSSVLALHGYAFLVSSQADDYTTATGGTQPRQTGFFESPAAAPRQGFFSSCPFTSGAGPRNFHKKGRT